ncbi:MAG TPA: RluA family pseudouridine synthase [Candidatus Saccharimonadales bacterium]|nr:RluA family pseudouridine synthase [Candidatus Saccharimonadales bacterium]
MNQTKPTLVISAAADSGSRIDALLAARTGRSRSFWQAELKAGRVRVGGQAVKPSYTVEEADRIEVDATSYHSLAPSDQFPAAPDLRVVYEDDDLLVIDKPSGMLTHASTGRREPTVADFAVVHTTDSDPLRPGIVHRLDRDTSGLLLIAKTAAAKLYLQGLFKTRQIHKTYLALARGRLRQPQAVIKLPIGRGQDGSLKQAVTHGGRFAETAYQVVGIYPGYNLIEVRPQTGRTHQLRVHLSAIGHPIAGDIVYGERDRPRGLSRQFLHAAKLELVGPSGQVLSLESPLPPDLAQFLAGLGPR